MNMLSGTIVINKKRQLLILLLIAFGLNVNTLFNEYAMDDVVVLTNNSLVQKGVKGIPQILTTDFFFGIENKKSDLSGGRYRPVALVTFALEYQLFGANPFVSHLISVLLFLLLVALLFKFLNNYIFKDPDTFPTTVPLAFITCLIFIVHPIHTEVIANVKSRDELITFILLLVSAFSFIRYTENRKAIQIIISLFSFFIALLTRESAVPFIALVPLMAYFFFNQTIKKSLLLSVPFAIVFAGYMALRLAMVGFTKASNLDIGNAPFLYATPSEAFATKVFILFKYVGLLIFPYPLSSDYGYNQIPYIGFTSVTFILSALFYTVLIIFAIYTFRKKSIYSFCIFFFLITIILFANFIIEIGAPLAERLLFQPSLAFCILLALLYSKAAKQFSLPAKIIMLMVLLLFSAKTILRNKDWKNNETLYFTDVLASPNSIRPNLYAANQYIKKALSEPNEELKKEYYSKAILYDERIASIHPDFRLHADLGLAYFGIKDYFNAASHWLLAYQMSPDDTDTRQRVMMLSEILFNEGNNFSKTGNATEAIRNYKKAVELNENNVDAWYNLSRTYAFIKDEANAREAWYQMQKHTTNPQPYPEQK